MYVPAEIAVVRPVALHDVPEFGTVQVAAVAVPEVAKAVATVATENLSVAAPPSAVEIAA